MAVAVVASNNNGEMMGAMTVEAPGDMALGNWTSGRPTHLSYTRVVPCIDPRLTSIIVEKDVVSLWLPRETSCDDRQPCQEAEIEELPGEQFLPK